MTKTKFVPLAIIISLIFTSTNLHAQLTTNAAILQKASIDTRIRDQQAYAKLLVAARQKGWPLTIARKNGSRAYLTRIDAKGYPIYIATNDNIISAATIKTNLLWPGGSSGLNLSGSNAQLAGRVALWDEGQPLHTHQEYVGRIVQGDTDTSVAFHATHVAGTMIAAGVNPLARGMSYGAPNLQAYDFNNDVPEMMAAAPNLLISNHSYGDIAGWYYNTDATPNRWEFWGNWGDTVDYKFGYYDTESQQWDSIAYNAPQYLIFESSGNWRNGDGYGNGPAVGQPYWRYSAGGVMVSAGNRPAGISNNALFQTIPPYGNAKNILTIGAVNPIPGGYTQPSDVVMTNFSDWGPTADGRLKPELVADGVNVLSCSNAANNAYAVASGTSMSSPASAGSGLLLQDYYSKLHAGAFMRSATLKGILIHTADEAGPSPGPDYMFGWGLINMQRAASVITSDTMALNPDQKIYENTLSNGGSFSLPVVASGKGPLVATICWTDPPGTVDAVNLFSTAKQLVNDLDLRVNSGATTYMPWILSPQDPNFSATTGDDTLNNVEKIVVNNATPGHAYTLNVTHKGTLARGQQAYTLLVSGVGGQPYCASLPASASGTRIDSVAMTNVDNINPPGCTTYTNYTNVTVNLQPLQTVAFTISLSSCDATANPRVVKIFIDYNNNGSFADPGETVATSAVLAGGVSTFSGSFTTPAGLTIGNNTLMRIVAEETIDTASVTPCGTYGNGETEDYGVLIVAPANDVGVTQINDPFETACANDSARLTVTISNFGTAPQVNVPLSATISNGASVIANLNVLCPDTIPAGGAVQYTFQSTFPIVAGNTYTISATSNLIGDQNLGNNQATSTLVVTTGASSGTGTAEVCSDTPQPPVASLKANLADTTNVAVWYDSFSSSVPLGTGNNLTTSTIPSNLTYYLALNNLSSSHVGPVNKMVHANGGYNAFVGNFVNITTSVPLTIQSARLYIGSAGQIIFTLAQIVNYDSTTGSYDYHPFAATTLNVYPTTPENPALGAQDNNPLDTGAVFFLNLPVVAPGKYSIIIQCQNGASIFRNNMITPDPYPFAIPGVFSITGSSAPNTQYYYFFYDMQIQLSNCPGPKVPVVATVATKPVITLSGTTLTSNVATGNQWYRNDSALAGATAPVFNLIGPGIYYTIVSDTLGCALQSNLIAYSPGNDIGLTVGPNPNNGQFNVQFYLATAQQVTLELYNTLGQRTYQSSYPNFSGLFTSTITQTNLAAGVYYLKVLTGNKSYVTKLVIN
jgi:Subtilase family/GEVED domain/Secretion system C-terminal sorting domain